MELDVACLLVCNTTLFYYISKSTLSEIIYRIISDFIESRIEFRTKIEHLCGYCCLAWDKFQWIDYMHIYICVLVFPIGLNLHTIKTRARSRTYTRYV